MGVGGATALDNDCHYKRDPCSNPSSPRFAAEPHDWTVNSINCGRVCGAELRGRCENSFMVISRKKYGPKMKQ